MKEMAGLQEKEDMKGRAELKKREELEVYEKR
jgi:hypothetical protein